VHAEALLSLAVTVAGEHSVEGVLDNIVKGLTSQPGIALARVWLLMPGDLCGSCFMRSECRDQTQCLHLVASAGTPNKSPNEDWSFLQGHFRRMPLNARKTGVIGAAGNPILIEDFAAKSEWIARPDWASREGIRAFAGHPLVFRRKTSLKGESDQQASNVEGVPVTDQRNLLVKPGIVAGSHFVVRSFKGKIRLKRP
jgi:hypothetical protein